MFLSIYHNQSGEEYTRRLSPNETLDLRKHVSQWCKSEFDGDLEPSFSEPSAHVFNGCGEYQAELRGTKKGGASCWTSEAFFLQEKEAAR